MGYFFNNETKSEFTYFRESFCPSLQELKLIIDNIYEIKKWDVKDKVVIFINSLDPECYIYQDGKYEQKDIEDDIDEDASDVSEEDSSDDIDEYYVSDDMDDRYEESFLTGGGYEDEFYECCDIY